MLRGALVNALSFILCFANIVGICCFQTTPSIVYGIAQLKGSPGINLVQVNATDGSTKVLQSVRYEAVAQELSSLDRVKNIYYIIGLNNTGQYKHPALLGFDLNNRGKLTVEVPLPFFELSFVGVSQAVQVDPVTSNVVLVGLDGTKKPPYHNVLLYDTKEKKVGRHFAHTGQRDCSTGCNKHHGRPRQWLLYVCFEFKWQGQYVDLRGSNPWIQSWKLHTDAGDHAKPFRDYGLRYENKKIYGVLGAERGKWEIGFYDVPRKKWYTKPILLESTWVGGIASVSAFSSNSRTLSLLLQPGTPEKPFQPSSTCAPKCAKDSLCCIDPKEGTASCFAVKTCSQITPGGGAPNMTLPFKLAQFNVDSGSLIASPDLCTLESCPWSLESE